MIGPLGGFIEGNKRRVDGWIDDSYYVMRSGLLLCIFSIFFTVFLYFVEQLLSTPNSWGISLYVEIIDAIIEAAAPIGFTIIFLLVRRVKNGLPKLRSRVAIVDFVSGLIAIVISLAGLFFLLSDVLSENPSIQSDFFELVPGIVFATSLLTVFSGLLMHGISLSLLQVLILVSDRKRFFAEAKALFTLEPVQNFFRYLGRVREYGEENNTSSVTVLKKSAIIGFRELQRSNGMNEELDIYTPLQTREQNSPKITSPHTIHIAIYYLMLLISTAYIISGLSNYIYEIVVSVAYIASIGGVLSGIYKDTNYITYCHQTWYPNGIFYPIGVFGLFVCASITISIQGQLDGDSFFLLLSSSTLFATSIYLIERYIHIGSLLK